MKRIFAVAIVIAAIFNPNIAKGADAGTVLDLLDLERPGLEKVAALHRQGADSLAAVELLSYYKTRTGVKSVGVDASKPKITKEQQRWADEGLEHRFFVHTGYQPSYFYGDDIDWQYWPVKDNELRWQLHRTKWWVPMGLAYRISGDENYAREWVAQYRDWIAKNPLTEFSGIKDKDMEKVDNVYFAWRPLEVGDRLEHQIEQFDLFLPSEHFTADFLIDFLDNYHRHADFVAHHWSKQGNHLLFEAQRLLFAGAYFPEFKEAAGWRAAGVDVLNREIAKQVLPDGVQYELDPGYHMAAINIFAKALEMMEANGYRDEFPASYRNTVEDMAVFTYNIMFPDYTLPMFSDCKLHTAKGMIPNYRRWRAAFPRNKEIKYFASRGRNGRLPQYTSRAFADGGFYTLRNGWDSTATVMVYKAGPAGEWHNQYDNGTFELWHRGRQYFPDSGSYIYGGDSTVLAQRNWFRQTAVHNTLTLNGQNFTTRRSNLVKTNIGDTAATTEYVVTETPGYEGLTHRRAVYFVDKNFYVIVDEAIGEATGDVAIHYNLLPCDPLENAVKRSVSTAFADGRGNVTLRVFGADKMTRTEGYTSKEYRHKTARPAYAFSKAKTGTTPVRFITVIYPTDADNPAAHAISAGFKGKDKVSVNIDGKTYNITL